MATIFALVNIPKAQLVGTANKSNTNKTISTGHLVKPKYETEIEVTRAIVRGELKFGTDLAYAAAREYQRELKKLNAPKFFRRKAGAPNTPSNRYMHTMFQKVG
jgi:hypothetical protein